MGAPGQPLHDGTRKRRTNTGGVTPRDQALILTARCLAALYRDRPDLIAHPTRGLALQLGFSPPA